MGNDISKGTTYATGGVGGQGTITSANLNAHVDDAVIKSTFISSKVERTAVSFTDNLLVEASGSLYRMLAGTLIQSGTIIQTVAATPYTANANLAAIPGDDTIPQDNEGTQILSVSIAPRYATSKIRLIFHGWGSADTAGQGVIVALFRATSVSALNVTHALCAANYRVQLSLDWVDTPGTTAAQTYNVRAGLFGTGIARMNGTSTTRMFGGASACTLVAQEIK